jgi:hypothetical protein
MMLGEVYIMDSDLGSNDKLWTAFEEEEFDLALTLIDKSRYQWSRRDWRNNGARGTALMGLQRFAEAAKEFALANELAAQETPAFSFLAFGEKEGAALWLSGKRELAAAKWKEIVEAMISGKKTMGDSAGGVSPCMLLWFAGQTLQDATLSDLAKKQLKKLSKGSKIKYWPGPLAAIALGTKSAELVFHEYCDTTQIKHSLDKQAEGYLDRRQLSQLFFYWGVECEVRGDAQGFSSRMAASYNQKIWQEPEWFLARSNVESL